MINYTDFSINLKDLLNKKSLYISIPKNKQIDNFNINIIESYKIKEHDFHINLFNVVKKYKTFIKDINDNHIKNNGKWNKLKLFTNIFELISYNNSNKFIKPIINYIPLSRAYFKLQELLIEFKLINNLNSSIKYAALAEGPGGFIECFINYRKEKFNGNNDNIYCITLKSDNIDIPGWNKIRNLLEFKKRININILYGKDNTGNLYNLKNIIDFSEKINGKMDFVTADGGFNYSANFNYQEQLSHQLIFCEIVTALTILNKNGNFVLKIFDIFTIITLQYIYILSNLFKEVIIHKPYTSRPANSERYLICKGYLGANKDLLENFYYIVEKWNLITLNKRYINCLFKIKVPPYFKKNIQIFNTYLAEFQIKNILKTLICNDFNKQQIDSLIRTQIVHCVYWAIKFNQPINFKSSFFKSFCS